MTDLASLSQALLAAVPADGSSIGNQTLLSHLQGQLAGLSEEQFRAARDELIAQGVLLKGRGRGGSVSRASVTGISLADQALSNARERRDPEIAEASASYLVQAATKVKPAKLQPATSLAVMEKTLWTTADKLRANMDAAEYKHIVLGLIFLKYISDSFAGRRAELEAKFADENDDYYLGDDDPELLAAELEDRDYYREVNAFWVPEVARWEFIRGAAKQVDIGKKIDDALAAIEAENPKLKNILDKRYARAQLPDGKLGELVDLISTIGFGDDANKARDLLGQVYEYFLGQFARAEGKNAGQFYTPASIVKTLVAVLNPHHGKVFDPCCGSGGMFVQSEKFIEAHGGRLGDVSIYGQESNPTTWRLAAMNIAIHGFEGNLGKEPADSFLRNQHSDLRADFVLAKNPAASTCSSLIHCRSPCWPLSRRSPSVAKAEVLPIELEDIAKVLPIIRQADRDEIEGALQIPLDTCLAEGLEQCCKASKIVVDGQIVALFGDSRYDEQMGIPWLVSTVHVERHPRAFLQVCKSEVEEMLTRHTIQNTPFANLFYTRAALDYLFLHSLQEALNPGALRRMERRIEKENAQRFLVSPSRNYLDTTGAVVDTVTEAFR